MIAALPAIIPNPVTPAISAMIKNRIALRTIIQVFDLEELKIHAKNHAI